MISSESKSHGEEAGHYSGMLCGLAGCVSSLDAPFPVSAFGDYRNYIEIRSANRSQDYVHAALAGNRIR